MNKQEELQRMIDESQNIVFFGGAGVSTESDIPDFRTGRKLAAVSVCTVHGAFDPHDRNVRRCRPVCRCGGQLDFDPKVHGCISKTFTETNHE